MINGRQLDSNSVVRTLHQNHRAARSIPAGGHLRTLILGPLPDFSLGAVTPHTHTHRPCKVLASGALASLWGNTACDTRDRPKKICCNLEQKLDVLTKHIRKSSRTNYNTRMDYPISFVFSKLSLQFCFSIMSSITKFWTMFPAKTLVNYSPLSLCFLNKS